MPVFVFFLKCSGLAAWPLLCHFIPPLWLMHCCCLHFKQLTGNLNIKAPFIQFMHTYIHNWPLQPFSQGYGLAFHTTHVVCFNFICEWWDLQFKVDFEGQIFEKLFRGRFIYSQSFCQKSAERKSPKKYFSFSYLMTKLGYESRILSLISRHTTYQTTATSCRLSSCSCIKLLVHNVTRAFHILPCQRSGLCLWFLNLN